MRVTTGTIWLAVLVGGLALTPSSRARAQQKPPRSSVVIPLGKEKGPPLKTITIHDTVTMVRVDTVRVVQTVARTDTVFRTVVRVDTLRDSCSRAIIPIPVPIPLDHHDQTVAVTPAPTATVTPEPETFVLVGSGLVAIIGFARYKRRK